MTEGAGEWYNACLACAQRLGTNTVENVALPPPQDRWLHWPTRVEGAESGTGLGWLQVQQRQTSGR